MACDPVNCARGNLLIFKADLVFQGLYGEEKWFRCYDSVLDYYGAFGKGWLYAFERFVFAEEKAAGWQITAMLPDTDKNRYSTTTTTYTHDGYGRMLTMTDAHGNTTKYAYEENIDLPTQEDTLEGYLYRYGYDRAGRRTKITTDYGTKELCYSETGAVSMEMDDLGNHTRYFYDSAGNMLKSIRPNWYDEQGDNREGTYYKYDYLDRPVLIKYLDGIPIR